MTYNVFGGTLNLAQSINQSIVIIILFILNPINKFTATPTTTIATTAILRLSGFCPRQPGWAGTRRKFLNKWMNEWKHSPTHIYRGHQSSLICFLRLLRSMASSLFNVRVWLSFCTISVQVFFGLPLGLVPSNSYSINLFTQSLICLKSIVSGSFYFMWEIWN